MEADTTILRKFVAVEIKLLMIHIYYKQRTISTIMPQQYRRYI